MRSLRFALLIVLALLPLPLSAQAAPAPLQLTLQRRTASGAPQHTSEAWDPTRTALIVCDMWDLHTCKNAMAREAEMAPRLDAVLQKARAQGVLVIHAPSSCMAAYEGTPARERARNAPASLQLPAKINEWCRQIPAELGVIYPIDQADGGNDDAPEVRAAWTKEMEAKRLNPRAPWTRQIDLLTIDQEKDAISDSGTEIWNLLDARGIDNVILAGVHVNMCVSGRPFGLRQMTKNGKNAVLLRDLTDAMYNPDSWPFVSHARGTGLFIEYLEKRICATITSDQILGDRAPFAFSEATAGPKRSRILLLGDSTTAATFPRLLAPDEPQLEDTIRILLALAPERHRSDVINLGLSGETVWSLLQSGRYDKEVASQPDADFIFIRYGINDRAKRENFSKNFPKDLEKLITRLREDHPNAQLIPTSVIPFSSDEASTEINGLIRQVASEQNLPYFELYPAYAEALKAGPNLLNYRRYTLDKIPADLQPLATPYVFPGAEPAVIVLDSRLDALFGHLPGWYGDRHPNLAGYQVIARETARYLAPLLAKTE